MHEKNHQSNPTNVESANHEPKNATAKKEQSAWVLALSVAYELGYLIAIPIVIFAFGGAYADRHFGTSPLFLLVGIGFAFCVTTVGIFRKLKGITDQLSRM